MNWSRDLITAKRLHNAAQGRGTPRTLGRTTPQQLSTPKGLHNWGGPLCNPLGVEIRF